MPRIGGAVRVVAVHGPIQVLQVKKRPVLVVLVDIKANDGPLILCGDFRLIQETAYMCSNLMHIFKGSVNPRLDATWTGKVNGH